MHRGKDLVSIQVEGISLLGYLTLPEEPKGIVLFAHGSGSSRNSTRNQFVAKVLNEHGLATLLLDLLTEEEEVIDSQTAELRFDIPLLAKRLKLATDWIETQESTKHLNVAYFGASTGAAAALIASVQKRGHIKSIVSRGGRPDLAGSSLPKVEAPTLLIVGGNDFQVIELNKLALSLLSCDKRLEIVPHATHLFEEPGTLEEAARLATLWFLSHF